MLEFLYALTTLFGYGSSDVCVKKALREKATVFEALFTRYAVEWVVLLPIVLLITPLVWPNAFLAGLTVFTAFVGAVAVIYYFKALQEGLLSLVSPFARASALVTLFLAVFFLGENLSLAQVLGAIIIIFSAVLIGVEKIKGLNLEQGVKFAVVTVLGWGLFFVLLKPVVQALNPWVSALYVEGLVLFFVAIYLLLAGQKLSLARGSAFKFLAGSGLFIVLSAVAYNYSILFIGAALTAAIVAGAPIYSTVLARFLFQEKIPPQKYLAILTLVIGLSLIALF